MKSIKKHLTFLCFFLIATASIQAQNLESTLDNILTEKYPANKPGATALIAKDGKVIYRKAFGMANLELNIPMKPENVFEIGSITKQFTSVSILMLMEQGKLDLQDEITKYLPDYPTNGKTITIHHLLNHTSGIKSYTSMSSFMSRAREDMSPVELIDVFKNEPMDFDPGEAYKYNNSAYIILGHIIEVVSGQSYADYIEQQIFQKLGMNNSHYGSNAKIINNRASGYQPTEDGYKNAEYLSMTLPYAGGSLMSCIDDMLLWEQALHKNTLITERSKQLAFTNYTLNNGNPIYYGYGFSVDEINGIPTIEHGGGIFGYTCYGVYVPSEDVYVIVLTNSNGNSPTDVTVEMAAHALGKPFPKEKEVKVSEKEMQQWTGSYEFEDGVVRYVTFKDGSLYSQREGSANLKLFPVSENEYYFSEGFSNYKFKKEKGKKVAMFISRINVSKGIESAQLPPAEKVAVKLTSEILKNYEGVYELQPNFDLTITTKDDRIFAMATGQQQLELFAENETDFFIKEIQAQLVFKIDDKGMAKSVTLFQGGQEIEGTRKE